MICNGHDQPNVFNNTIISESPSSKDTSFEEYTNKQDKSKKEKEFLKSNSCCSIYYADIILKNMHKRWSIID